MRCLTTLLTALVLLAGTAGARADDVYQDPRAFLEEVFGGTVPAPQKRPCAAGRGDRCSLP